MSDIIKKNQNDSALSLVERAALIKINRDRVLLMDTSLSMGVTMENHKTRYDIVKLLVPKFPGLKKFVFNSHCEVAQHPLQAPTGSTNLTSALREMKLNNFKHIILLTDGQPNNAESALHEAVGLKIDSIYIGDGNIPDFLHELANFTQGSVEKVDLVKIGAFTLLENKIKGLLSA